ncbi:Crp/Fnr family transcriptional regulator [Achromobacter kerstersii]|uniref:Ferredoxin--NADP reductase n=1 Tax=Achromobacter kerstersii TaxID=1353890 RepID=A0A6S6ZBZ5_9BURK|nr:Crp/Fnr family transcriptional regulator [Achromobacter kerstersii]CAB3660517.1 Ferredoxin--NADP reductase [Achromobacter kerstersii]
MNRLATDSACQPADLPALHAQAFPMLTPALIDRAASHGEIISVPAGTVLLKSGECEAAFYIVLEGYAEVLECEPGGAMHSLLMHRDGEFTGSLDLFTDRPNAVTVRADSPSRLLRISRAALAQLLLTERELADVVLRAFMLRRIGYLRQRPYGGAILRSAMPPGEEDSVLDLTVIGGGPAGLAAASYAASEGLQTLLVGGSLCGPDALREDVLRGFPGTITGLCGGGLLRRAEVQSRRFGSHVLPGRTATAFDEACYPYRVWLDDGQMIETRSLIVATGMQKGETPQTAGDANTAWLDGCLDTDDRGYIHTGRAAAGSMQARAYESSQPGVFAVGAVRAGSDKHVLASIAEGAAAVRVVHRFLDASAH